MCQQSEQEKEITLLARFQLHRCLPQFSQAHSIGGGLLLQVVQLLSSKFLTTWSAGTQHSPLGLEVKCKSLPQAGALGNMGAEVIKLHSCFLLKHLGLS